MGGWNGTTGGAGALRTEQPIFRNEEAKALSSRAKRGRWQGRWEEALTSWLPGVYGTSDVFAASGRKKAIRLIYPVDPSSQKKGWNMGR